MRGYLPLVNILLAIALVAVVARGIYPAVTTRTATETALESMDAEMETPRAPEGRSQGDYKIIDSRNIFFSGKISPPPPPAALPTAVPTAPPTPLKLELQGTMVHSGSKSGGMAAIKDLRTGKDDVYHVGDSIGDTGAVIVLVERNKVTLERGGKKEVLLSYKDAISGTSTIASKKPEPRKKPYEDIIKVISPYKREVSKSGLHAAVGNIFQAMDSSGIEVRRNYLNRKERKNQRGYKVWNIPQDSIVAAMGIRDHDIIMRVNRKLIDSPKKALTLFQEVQNAKTVKIEIERNRRRINLSYKIKP
ncbi:MAG: type II secretion system protein N [Candidatus Tritonobacter lacicola]|nr:type II secretion system protein N [Candidatus Tritonobacter lacicola]